jgi:aarF domain-containing kinase
VNNANAFLFVKQELDTEIIVAAARSSDATAISANVVVDERQMNALFLDLVSFLIF